MSTLRILSDTCLTVFAIASVRCGRKLKETYRTGLPIRLPTFDLLLQIVIGESVMFRLFAQP